MGADMAKIQFALSNTQETYPRGWTICVDLSVQSTPRILLTYMIIVSPNYPQKEIITEFSKKLDNPVALSEIFNTLQEMDPSLPIDYIKLQDTLFMFINNKSHICDNKIITRNKRNELKHFSLLS